MAVRNGSHPEAMPFDEVVAEGLQLEKPEPMGIDEARRHVEQIRQQVMFVLGGLDVPGEDIEALVRSVCLHPLRLMVTECDDLLKTLGGRDA